MIEESDKHKDFHETKFLFDQIDSKHDGLLDLQEIELFL